MRKLKSFSIAFLLLSLVVCVLAAPAVTENSDTCGSGAHEPAFSLIQVFDHLKFLEVKDKRTKETINFPAPVNAEVKLHGKPARLLDLRKGDDISLEFSNGELNSVNALRTTSGIMLDGDCKHVTFTSDYVDRKQLNISPTTIVELNGKQALLCDAKRGDSISIQADATGHVVKLDIVRKSPASLLWDNFRKNLFKPLLLFFMVGLAIPLLKIALDFPHAVYQGFTIYLLIAIGWHGGEELVCGSSSYIAVPAIQRLAIPEASPTLPLATSLGLTFVYNVTAGIPLYLFLAQQILTYYPVVKWQIRKPVATWNNPVGRDERIGRR